MITIESSLYSPLHLWMESFVFPAILGWYVVACFPVRSYLRPLHVLVCVASIYSAAIGAAELVLGRDLLPLPGAFEALAGNYQGLLLLRPNGPYVAGHSFGMIGLATFFFLAFLGHILPKELPPWHKLLHRLGISAALLQSMLSLHRSIFITIVLVFILDLFRRMTRHRKMLRVAFLSSLAIGLIAISVKIPELFSDRVSDPASIYARLAQQRQNLSFFLQHPLMGVGFNNFYQVASHKPTLTFYLQGIDSMDVPHSNFGQALTETGLIGFIPYFLSQVLLVSAFWKLRSSSGPVGEAAWPIFVNIFLAYWIQGMAMASGYYSDLNLWYMFCFAAIYKYVITQDKYGISNKAELS